MRFPSRSGQNGEMNLLMEEKPGIPVQLKGHIFIQSM